MTFDPTKSCPIITNFECVQDDCGFWQADDISTPRGCVLQHGLVSLEGRHSVEFDLLPAYGWQYYYMGDWVKNVRILTRYNDCELKFYPPANQPTIQLYKKWGRVGNQMTFSGLNCYYIIIRSVGVIPISGQPGYAEIFVDADEGGT